MIGERGRGMVYGEGDRMLEGRRKLDNLYRIAKFESQIVPD